MADHEGSTRPRVVIVGGVAGGASCAARLRRCCEDAEITMIERGPYVSYANCGMPYAVGNVVPDDKLVVTQPSTFRDRFKIDVRVNTNAVRIDRERKVLVVEETDNPEAVDEIGYDHLVLATGARAFMPPWPGADLPGIFHLRTIPETLAVKAWIADHGSGEAVVVGGGFIGLELAENLVALGVTTTLVEFAGQICPPADPSMAGLILDGALAHVAATHGSEKLGVRLGEGVESFAAAAAEAGEEGDGNQQQILVNTNKGNQISASFVVVCVGVRPESGLAVDAGLDTGRHDAVVVDEYMTTSDRSILAVGDVVAKTDLVTGQPINLALAGPANRQGRTAADVIALRVHAALAGNEPSYPPKLGFAGVVGTWVLGFCGMVAAGTGANAAALRRADIPFRACVVHPAHHVSYYPGAKKMALKLLYGPEDGRVLGAQAVGEAGVERRIDVIASYIKMGATVWDLKEAELCYAPAFGAAKDPVNLAGFVATNDLEGTSPLIWWHEHEVSPDDNHVYLDVRNQDEWDEFSVDGFVLVPLNDLRGRVEGILGAPRHDLAVFVTCAVGQRAHYAARILIEMGYAVKSFAGGVKTYRALNRAQALMADAS